MKILISGAGGFVGENLMDYLSNKNFEFIKIKRNTQGPNAYTYNEISGEVLDKKGIKALVHLAGKAHDLQNKSHLDEYLAVNTELTKHLFRSFLKSDIPVFIFMSSVKAVADSIEGYLTEEITPSPSTPYGISKRRAEEFILENLESAQSKRIYILRPCIMHGPGNKGNLNLLYRLVSKGIPWPLGAFENKRSFCSIENMCFVIEQLIRDESIESGIYNVSDDMPISTNELIKIMGSSIQKKTRIWKIPVKFISVMAQIGTLFKLPLNNNRLKKLTESYLVSNHKLLKSLGRPLPIVAEEGLTKTFISFNP